MDQPSPKKQDHYPELITSLYQMLEGYMNRTKTVRKDRLRTPLNAQPTPPDGLPHLPIKTTHRGKGGMASPIAGVAARLAVTVSICETTIEFCRLNIIGKLK